MRTGGGGIVVSMSKRILVVDDEADATQLLEFNLRRASFDVQTEASGAAAMRAALAAPPDLIVLDLLLPDVDGFAVCELLRSDPRTARVPVLILTAFSSEDARVIGLELGADDYLVKPFSPRELILRLERILERRRLAVAG